MTGPLNKYDVFCCVSVPRWLVQPSADGGRYAKRRDTTYDPRPTVAFRCAHIDCPVDKIISSGQ